MHHSSLYSRVVESQDTFIVGSVTFMLNHVHVHVHSFGILSEVLRISETLS